MELNYINCAALPENPIYLRQSGGVACRVSELFAIRNARLATAIEERI